MRPAERPVAAAPGPASGWIRRFHHAAPDAPRLLCLPHAGGSAGFFTGLSAALSPAVDVVAVQYPGRQDRRREPAVTSLPLLADQVFQALAPFGDRPLALFGHSMGATLAFEVAARLESHGRAVTRLVASGRRAPSRHRDENVHRRDDEGVVQELRRLGGSEPWFSRRPLLPDGLRGRDPRGARGAAPPR